MRLGFGLAAVWVVWWHCTYVAPELVYGLNPSATLIIMRGVLSLGLLVAAIFGVWWIAVGFRSN
jgi:hypothetical protein